MREFLRGWRRKAGVVSLVMACVVCGLWARSFVIGDWITFYPTSDRRIDVKSDRGRFGIEWGPYDNLKPSWFHWTSDKFMPYIVMLGYIDDKTEQTDGDWQLNWGVFSVGKYSYVYGRTVATYWVMPYWVPALSLTLLSAYLILWKPRKRDSRPPQS